MADIELIIKLPEEQYRTLNAKSQNDVVTAIDHALLIEAIKNGTPLPKGHGKLFDAREYENSIRKHYFDNDTVIRCTEIALGNAPTIIEADTEERARNEKNT